MTNKYTIQENDGQLKAVRLSDNKLLGYITGTTDKHYQALRSQINRYGWEEETS
ncbi:hypothetical protein [Salimicrobium halophilum]|uniref:Uncharacterized protein n=1 Tax=Salimicrobium halophilum TaxID=86666 RepID=A0A1G8WEM0_9BACI|nr:hypothetical protein [Salimicrobium halophilum]SDJ76596.1 hypothetical protein SAMN04490247_3151 [Salimicrobium halophilum]